MNGITWAAGVLAGGRSSRMGTDKAFLQFNGQPLWEYQMNRLRQMQADQLLLSGRTDTIYGGIDAIVDIQPDAGPLSGLCALLEASRQPLLLLLAVDMPHLPTEYLGELLQQCGPAIGVVPRLGDRYEPVAAVYPREILPLAEELLQQEQYSLQRLVQQGIAAGLLIAAAVPPEHTVWFTSLNTPEDLLLLQCGFSGFR